MCIRDRVQSPRWREDSWPRAREASPKRAGAGRPAAGATGSPRSSPRKGLPWSTAAAPRGGRGKPGKWPGRRSSAARAGGLVGPVNRRCSSRGAFAQHGSQVPAVPPQGVKCRTRCMQSTNPPPEKAYLARCYLRALAGGCACPRIPDARNLRAVLVCQGWKQALPGGGGCVLVREGSVYGG